MNNSNQQSRGFFTDLKNTSPYFKCAAQGMAGTGKTFTTALIAVGLHKRIGSTKPIIIFDTEKSAKFLKPMFAEAGIRVLVKQSRTLPDLTKTMQLCGDGEADILIIDSITHVYEAFLNDYQQKKGRKYLQFQDWAFLKPTWKREFSDRLVNCPCHILFTGREGYTYEQQLNEDTGKKEIVKTGVKMKAEGETAYEPDLLLRMERFEEILDHDKPKRVWREATVIKDRSDQLDGKTFEDPSYEHFALVIEFLLTDPEPATATDSRPNADLIGEEDDNRQARQKAKIELERIQKMLDKVAAGTTADAKATRTALCEYGFHGETSETAIACMTLDQLLEASGRLAPLCRAIYEVTRWETHVYPVPKAVAAARQKYLGTTNLGESTVEKLSEYASHMDEKYKAMNAKKDEAAA